MDNIVSVQKVWSFDVYITEQQSSCLCCSMENAITQTSCSECERKLKLLNCFCTEPEVSGFGSFCQGNIDTLFPIVNDRTFLTSA